ncbi:PRC-barrel domain-containing protein [Aliiroseovarius sediminis]|uniref:PRC-barrel domain-containing protein n=1 Tax=Aliiroseovarius sediminis TaxID=2925839 RepID=UPI001F592A16|nr:PRC-barrel domain-containing protein [Aliiroseovarius sediminis]MCI2394023.1 PRC-barrel domain-containing protein [Aliiroseovarius sediminis]
MKNLLMTAAIAVTAGTAAQADVLDRANMLRADDIEDGRVYAVDATQWGEDVTFDGVDDNWDVVGEVEDIVLSRDGQMAGVIAEVGGFLDIGDKDVFIEMKDLRLIQTDTDEYGVVISLTKDQLMDKPDLEEGFWD